MSYKQSLHENFESNVTFQNNLHNIPYFPLPPPPPPPAMPYFFTPELPDQEFIKKFESHLNTKEPKMRVTRYRISELKESLLTIIFSLNDIKEQEKKLSANTHTFSEEEWSSALSNIEMNKNCVNDTMLKLSSSYLDLSRKLLAKRTAKRLRLKRLREERKREKQERIKLLEERSRKIDENLQKIKDDIYKAKQEEEAKIEADIILKEVMRKKHDAKKNINKLDALVKLRRARQNTAKGKGQIVSDSEADAFQENIGRLKSLWVHKLSTYETEEVELREKLEKNSTQTESLGVMEREVEVNLAKWREVLFGGADNPQVDFKGDISRFIAVRSEWDCFIDNGEESSPIPMGWVVPVSNFDKN